MIAVGLAREDRGVAPLEYRRVSVATSIELPTISQQDGVRLDQRTVLEHETQGISQR
jgi:hypothetical protein